MSESDNGHALTPQNSEAAQGFTAETVLRTLPKTYRAIVRLLAEPDARVDHIAKLHRVSTHTVRAIRARQSIAIAERKKSLAAMLANVAELGAGRMEETISKASLRDATIGTGVAVDKLLALTGQLPSVNVAVVNMPSEAEREERQTDAKLDAIARRLEAMDTPEA